MMSKTRYRPIARCSRWEFVGMLGDDEHKAGVSALPGGRVVGAVRRADSGIEYGAFVKAAQVTVAGDGHGLRVLVHGQVALAEQA